MRILVTGFEPFGSDSENASEQAVRRLADRAAAGAGVLGQDVELSTAILPVSFARSGPALVEAAERAHPDAILAVGEAGGRDAITPEVYGVNCDIGRIPDNDGAQPRETPIDDGPDRRTSGLDPDALVAAVRAVGLQARTSDNAGRFVCNHIAYLVAALSGPSGPIPGGFVHVPAVRTAGLASVGAETDPDARQPGSTLTVDDLARALAACVNDIAGRLSGR